MFVCERGDSNPHEQAHYHLKVARLPVPPLPHIFETTSYHFSYIPFNPYFIPLPLPENFFLGYVVEMKVLTLISLFFVTYLQAETLTFEQFKKELTSGLTQYVKSQEENVTYKRGELIPLTKEFANRPIPLPAQPKNITHFSKGATFYSYNAETTRDYRWGCAWRAIQTSLSSYGIFQPFNILFYMFGPEKNLEILYRNLYPNDSLIFTKPFAPYDLTMGWAEPFVGQLVFHFYGITSDLELVNGLPSNAHAPQMAFRHSPLDFATFKTRLENHFKQEKPAPVMIDDGTLAMNIIGIAAEGTNTVLWISDPHIQEGVNQNPERMVGLYTITLDNIGRQIDSSLKGINKEILPFMMNEHGYKNLHFRNKHWMILFPQ